MGVLARLVLVHPMELVVQVETGGVLLCFPVDFLVKAAALESVWTARLGLLLFHTYPGHRDVHFRHLQIVRGVVE